MLDSLQSVTSPPEADIVVVDNDVEGSAHSVATNHPVRPTYVVEPEPGISAARNRALAHFSDRYHAIIFVDDDEWVTPTWLTTLTTYAAQTGADVVTGPVESVFLEPAPEWVQRGGFFQGRFPAPGEEMRTAAANNTLLSREMWIRAGSPRFDPRFSMTGGEDTDFFLGLRKAGATIRFCADATVYEEIPPDRQSLRWWRRRAVRAGVTDTLVRLKHHDSLVVGLAKGVRSAAYGLLALTWGLITRRGVQQRPYISVFFAYGQFAALFNYQIEEYARPGDSSEKR